VVAPRVARRIGLLNTMVWTHLPSNILLIAVPFAPTLPLAIAALLGRFALSQMDVPTRQAYIAAMVDPAERTAAAAATNSARYAARPFGPLVATALIRSVALGAPWVAAGAIKTGYDLVLWRVFSKVPLPDDAA
jgi:predicted MFS family arabinose efflux permease